MRNNAHHTQQYIDGTWIASGSDELIDVINPATEETMSQVPAGTVDDIDKAVHAARDASDLWAVSSRKEREDALAAIIEGLEKRGEEIATTISQEMGAPTQLANAVQLGLPHMTGATA